MRPKPERYQCAWLAVRSPSITHTQFDVDCLPADLSEKNPLEILPDTSSILEILSVFSQGTHRGKRQCKFSEAVVLTQCPVLVRAGSSKPAEYLGFVSDRALLSYFHRHAQESTAFSHYLSNPLHSLHLPSLNLRTSVVYCSSKGVVLDAMKLMSEQGVSSVAIVGDSPSPPSVTLLSAVSVTDIGKV